MQGPRANWACLSKKCQQDGAATIYELPVSSVCCPACGSRRIKRLYDSINISSGLAKRTDALVEPAYTQATAGQDAVKRAEKQNGPALAVPLGAIGATLAKLGMPAMNINAPNGKAVAIPRAPPENFLPFQQQAPRPHVLARDTEYTIKRTADGALVPAKQ